jgi:hypothetical protein
MKKSYEEENFLKPRNFSFMGKEDNRPWEKSSRNFQGLPQGNRSQAPQKRSHGGTPQFLEPYPSEREIRTKEHDEFSLVSRLPVHIAKRKEGLPNEVESTCRYQRVIWSTEDRIPDLQKTRKIGSTEANHQGRGAEERGLLSCSLFRKRQGLPDYSISRKKKLHSRYLQEEAFVRSVAFRF